MKKTQQKKKHTFMIKNTSLLEVDTTYGLKSPGNISITPNPLPSNVTKIDDISNVHKQSPYISFIDETRKHCVTMVDSVSRRQLKASNCFWCRHPFPYVPIGCPLKYVNSKILKTHVSEITNDTYVIRKQITHHDTQTYEPKKGSEQMIPQNYYQTEGCFCSFNCCLAYIDEHKHNVIYRNSRHLLMRMYMEVFETLLYPF